MKCVVQFWLSWKRYSLSPRLLLTMGLLVGISLGVTGRGPAQARHHHQSSSVMAAIQYPLPGAGSSPMLTDGTYLFGESTQPNQTEVEYLVFQVRRARVTGAFFMPQSGFDCFAGTLAAGQLDVTFSPSAWQPESTYTVSLKRFYPLSMEDNDQRILNQCLQEQERTALELN